MRKKTYVTVCWMLVCIVLMGGVTASVCEGQNEETLRLAIVDFSIASQDSELSQLANVIPEWLTTFLVKKPGLELIERRQLQQVLQEQTLGQSGVLDEQSAARVGSVLGIDVLVTGTVISIADTLEVTARLVDTTNGTILGAVSVLVEDVDELRDHTEDLADMIAKTLRKDVLAADAKVFESFDTEEFDTGRWIFEFGEQTKKSDQEQTDILQEDDVLRITGSYRGEDDDRYAWMVPGSEARYTMIHARVRVRDLTGGVGICLGASWDEDEHTWASTSICPYFGEGGGDVTIIMEDEEETEEYFEVGVETDTWYHIRLEYQQGQFAYYWNDRLVTQKTSQTPGDGAGTFYADIGFWLEQAEEMTIEIDEIILR